MTAKNVTHPSDPRPVFDRSAAARTLAAVDLPLALPFEPDEWPIASAMLQFPSVTATGLSIREAGPERWRRDLGLIARQGFTGVEVPNAWLPFENMPSREHDDLKAILQDIGLALYATAIGRCSIIDPTDAIANMAANHRAIDASAALGAPVLNLGLHGSIRPEQADVTWFWTVPGNRSPDDRGVWKAAVSRCRELADHAAQVGVQLSLELYERTYLGTADSAVAFVKEIDRPNVGLNPDLGNLIRAQEDIEPWESMAVKTLPFANYWHVKNYARAEHPQAGIYLTSPAPMMVGLIDYRKAIAFAIAQGFRGAFMCENYGGDGLSVTAENHRYIRRLLADMGAEAPKQAQAPANRGQA